MSSIPIKSRRLSNLEVIRRSIALLTAREHALAIGLLCLMILVGLLEASVVALVLPFVYVLVDPQRIASLKVLSELMAFIDMTPETLMPLLSMGLIALLIFAAVASSLTNHLSELQTEKSRNRLARLVLERIMQAPYLWTIQKDSSMLTKVIYDDVRIWRRDCLQSLLSIAQAGILIIFPAIAVLFLAPLNGFIALLVLGVCSGMSIFLVRKPILRLSLLARDTHAKVVSILMQVLNGVREIKVSRKPSFFLDSFDSWHADLNRLQIRIRRLARTPAAALTLIGQIGFIVIALILWGSGYSGAEIFGLVAVIGVVVTRVLPAANRLNSSVTVLLGALPYIEGLLIIIEEAKNDQGWLAEEVRTKFPLSRNWRKLKLDSVDFKFPSSDLGVRRVDLEFQRGKVYGIVGRSGSGKSTLMNLLLGLLSPTSGRILIDGRLRDTLSPSDWLEQIAYVPQDVFILDDTVFSNITFGSEPPDVYKRMEAALGVACLDAVISDLPDGLDTRLGGRGRRLSGGQAQRVAIARAIFKRPTVLLLDEATSALDSITEAQVQSNLHLQSENALVIAISHRVSSLRGCDEIVVLDKGHVLDVGPYEDLFRRCSLFVELAAQPEGVPMDKADRCTVSPGATRL